jgi:LmbE family N-acetylglucosaminyl deacetylase
VAAHSDDEALGCGGTIAKHSAEWDKVDVMFMTDGVSSRSGVGVSEVSGRHKASQQAAAIMGINSIHSLSFPDNEMDKVGLLDIVRAIEDLCRVIQPEIVYTHHHGDLNVDHRLTHQAVMTACRPMPSSNVKEIYGFEVLSSTEWNSPVSSMVFIPNCFVDITNHISQKISAVNAYLDEMREIPHSRSVKHCEVLAAHRGYTIGVRAAEAFATYRLIR